MNIKNKIYYLACSIIILLSLVALSISNTIGLPEDMPCQLDPSIYRAMKLVKRTRITKNTLIGISKYGDKSVLLINRVTKDNEGKYISANYSSVNHGDTWSRNKSNKLYTNLNYFSYRAFEGIRDHGDEDVRWRINWDSKIMLSRDGGESWEEISPKIENRSENIRITFINAGRNNKGRLYAGIILKEPERGHAIYRSDDYGRRFSRISNEVRYAFESPVDQNLMIGVSIGDKNGQEWIMISNDGGKSWNKTATNIIIRRLETHPNYPPWIGQIEFDPIDRNTFYVLTWTGLYATRDLGKTFSLLPLAMEYIAGIDMIAVDAIDSRYLYAIVKDEELFRSSDYGCTWKRISLP